MRTAGTRPGSRPAGEGAPPKEGQACLGCPSWAGGEYPADCHESVERYPEAPGLCLGRPVTHGVRFRTPWFYFARKGVLCDPEQI